MIFERPLVLFDLETTGVDVEESRIVEIAMIKILQDGSMEEKRYLINPEVPIPIEASEVHGIYYDDIKGSPVFRQLAKGITEYIADCDLGGHNSNRFDIPLLIKELSRCGYYPDLSQVNFLDTIQIERKLYSMKLEAIYERRFGEKLEGAHNALYDIKATHRLLMAQIEDLKELGMEDLTAQKLDEYAQGDNKRVDLAGKLCLIEDKICWNFGKNRHKPVRETPSYVQWFLRQGVPRETRIIIEKLIKTHE